MSRYILVPLLLIILLAGCVPAGEQDSGNVTQTIDATSEPATPPPPLVVTDVSPLAEPSQTYVPVVQAEEGLTPTATVRPGPTSTPGPTATPRSPVNSIDLEPFLAGGLDRPLYLTHAGDDRLFVIEQVGRIRVIEDGQLVSQPFLDLLDRVGSVGNEQGLLSVAFPPDYLQEDQPGFGKFYVNYTTYGGSTHVSRFSVNPENRNVADKNSEVILLEVEQPYANHNGGLLKFGPDDYLYVGMGDGGSANDPDNNGQTPGTLLGSLLRLDVSDGGETYSIPADNPFVGQTDRRAEIWAWGLRNPWRYSFDRLTGDLYIADVGQNVWEELNFQPASSNGGENYGWNIMEGTHCFLDDACDPTGLVLPVADYQHGQSCSVTGGYVYRGQAYPQMTGNYFFGDYCSGIIWRLYPDENGGWETVQVLDSDLLLTSFGEDARGELYALDRTSGAIFRLVPGG